MNDSVCLIKYSQRSSDSECIARRDQDFEHQHVIEGRPPRNLWYGVDDVEGAGQEASVVVSAQPVQSARIS
jgi:predicted nuclease of predicted toxin-antitoxin system